MPLPMASETLRALISLPRRNSRPEMSRPYERPKMLIASSVRPAPMRPAMPTTSPARTVKPAPSTTLRSWVGCQTVQSSTPEDLLTGVRRPLGVEALQVAADHAADDAFLGD